VRTSEVALLFYFIIIPLNTLWQGDGFTQ